MTLKRRSKKRQEEDRLYKQAIREYCEELRAKQKDPPDEGLGVWCEAGLDHGEYLVADHIHHKKYRRGKDLYDKDYFMAVAYPWHPLRIHQGEQHNGERKYGPKWAREMGYIVDV